MVLVPGRGRTDGPTLHVNLCATVTAGSCALHVWLAAAGHHPGWLGAVMIAMVALCLPCSVHIWRQYRIGTVQQVMVSSLLMAVLHMFLLLAAGASGHSHAGAAAAGLAATSSADAAAATLAVVAFELLTALLAATLVARLRTGRGKPPVVFAGSSNTYA
ncbi:MAG: hypothetical protein ABIQ22_15700 [Arthrobacter oryzae]